MSFREALPLWPEYTGCHCFQSHYALGILSKLWAFRPRCPSCKKRTIRRSAPAPQYLCAFPLFQKGSYWCTAGAGSPFASPTISKTPQLLRVERLANLPWALPPWSSPSCDWQAGTSYWQCAVHLSRGMNTWRQVSCCCLRPSPNDNVVIDIYKYLKTR